MKSRLNEARTDETGASLMLVIVFVMIFSVIIAAILDSIYQLKVHRGVFLGELIVTAVVLAIFPYLFVRGPVSRIARRKPIEKQVIRKAS